MGDIMKGGDVEFKYEALDSSTAEFLRKKESNMREIVGRAYTELGRELKEAKEVLSNNRNGIFQKWVESIGFKKDKAYDLIRRYELIVGISDDKREFVEDIPVSLAYEIAKPSAESTEPKRKAKEAVLGGDVKTLKEYRELVTKLKEAQQAADEANRQRDMAERDAKILRDTLESIESSEPEVKYIEVNNQDTDRELLKYKELFGDISMYEGKTTRVTNGDAITYSVFEFSKDVREFIQKYGHLTHFSREFNEMIDEGKEEYQNSIALMFKFLKSVERNLDSEDVLIINN